MLSLAHALGWRRSGDAPARERSTALVRARPLAAILIPALLGCAGAPAGAGAAARPGPPARTQLGPAREPARARASAHHGPSVSAVLTALLHASQIEAAVYDKDLGTYVAAKGALARLTGTRRSELAGVMTNVQAIAASGQLSASRLAATFLTLERNLAWWTTEARGGGSQRVTFPGSEIVWQHYPGQGIEIQWLATFGAGNALYARRENTRLRRLLDEVIPLAGQRAGGIAWEYMFDFDGGTPPWTSGLSQGTAVQLLARAYARFKEPAYQTAAQQALGIFQTPPPQGVRVSAPVGALYAQYSFAPRDRILNGFIQALVGLYDYTSLTGDPLGQQLFAAGDAEARVLVPRYDTGSWSLYDQFGESSLSYHELLTEFLQHLCERTRKGPALGPQAPLSQDAIYCTTAQHFAADLATPPEVALVSRTLRGGTRAGVVVSLSKISLVRLTVRHAGRVVWTVAATVGAGRPRLLWPTPPAGGSFAVTLTATDLAGNTATASGTLTVTHR